MLCLVLVAGIQQNRIRCFIGFEEQFEEQKEGTIEGKKTSELVNSFFPLFNIVFSLLGKRRRVTEINFSRFFSRKLEKKKKKKEE